MKFKGFENKLCISSSIMHGEEMEYIKETYETKLMSTVGKIINEVKKINCEKIGCKYAVALSAGTAALHLAMKAATGVRHGERIFCSDMTFDGTLNALVYEGGIPAFIDSEYETWNMDPKALEKFFEIYPEVKVVDIVHLYGTPCQMYEVKEFCNRHDAIIIEDAAEALVATYKSKICGQFNNYNTILFNGNKIITGSSGGMFFVDDEEKNHKLRKWLTQSRENISLYQHEESRYNYRMSNVIAGVVRNQYEYLDKHISQKKVIYERYREELKDLLLQMNLVDIGNASPNYWLSCILISGEAMYNQDRSEHDYFYKLEKGKSCSHEIFDTSLKYNVDRSPVWKPMHTQPNYRTDSIFITKIGA